MRQQTSEQKKYKAGLALLFAAALTACSPVASGSWYDSEKGQKPKAEKTKMEPKKAEEKAAQKADTEKQAQAGRLARFGELLSGVRDKLDRRPEAQKQRDRQKRERVYGKQATPAKTDRAAKASSPKSAASGNGLVTVKKGETYYSMARKYNVPLRALLAANKARPPYVLSPGDRIAIPQQQFYAVKSKDTLYSISRAHDTDVASLAKLNGLKQPYTISVGQRLQIPGQGGAGRARAPSPAGKTSNKVASRAVKPSAKQALPQAPKRVGRFRVPVQGPVISSFGPKDGGLHNDGINIAARSGAPIVAAENGVVVYTGNELRGYGNLLLIRHSGGWVTAYAHISKFRVKPGTKVKQGEVIAEVGQTGNVDRPQLHFELRKGTRAVNPQSLI